MNSELTRRRFLLRSVSGATAAWAAAQWPAVLAASEHAHRAAEDPATYKFQFFTPEEAAEVDAIAARIIPSGDSPGAREAGAVFFIDEALATFAAEAQAVYRKGIPDLQSHVRDLFPTARKFSDATPEQQDEVLHAIDTSAAGPRRNLRPNSSAPSFFEVARTHTITAFLIDPESGGNRDGVGWKLIGRDLDHAFQPPFGFYDKDYPGWQPESASGEKK